VGLFVLALPWGFHIILMEIRGFSNGKGRDGKIDNLDA
jgi:hypothetical protein